MLCDYEKYKYIRDFIDCRSQSLSNYSERQKYKSDEILFEMNNDLKSTNPKGTFVTSVVGCYYLKTDSIDSLIKKNYSNCLDPLKAHFVIKLSFLGQYYP